MIKHKIKNSHINSSLLIYPFNGRGIAPRTKEQISNDSNRWIKRYRLTNLSLHYDGVHEHEQNISLNQVSCQLNVPEQIQSKNALRSNFGFNKAFAEKYKRKPSVSSYINKALYTTGNKRSVRCLGVPMVDNTRENHSIVLPVLNRHFRFFSFVGPVQSEHNSNQIANLELASCYIPYYDKIRLANKQRTQRLPNSANQLKCQQLISFPPNRDKSLKTCKAVQAIVRRLFPMQRPSRRAARALPSAGFISRINFQTSTDQVTKQQSVELPTTHFEQLCNITFGNSLLKSYIKS